MIRSLLKRAARLPLFRLKNCNSKRKSFDHCPRNETYHLISSRSPSTIIRKLQKNSLRKYIFSSSGKKKCSFPSLNSIFRQVMARCPHLLHALTWTILLGLMVSIASFAPKMAFVSAVSPASSFSRSCNTEGLVRIPLDFPREKLCLPAHTVKRSKVDFFVPTVFAGLVVAASACMVRSLGLWESETG